MTSKRSSITRRLTTTVGLAVIISASGLPGIPTTFNPLVITSAAAANGFTVDTVGDSADKAVGDGKCKDDGDTCSLRAALQELSAVGGGSIVFDIKSQCGVDGVCTISPSAALPTVTSPISIDGYSQCDNDSGFCSRPNSLEVGDNSKHLIHLNGKFAGPGADGLSYNNYSSSSTGVVNITGMVISGFSQTQVSVAGFDTFLSGNFIGTNTTGDKLERYADGDHVRGVALTNGYYDIDHTNRIGSASARDRNVLASVVVNDSRDTFVLGNYVGTNAAGTASLGNNGYGISSGTLGSTHGHLTIGASTATPGTNAGNVISGNALDGVRVVSRIGTTMGSVSVQGNIIGLDAAGKNALPNGGSGVYIRDNNLDDDVAAMGTVQIGGVASEKNVISGNTNIDDGTTPFGVVVASARSIVQSNAIGTDAAGGRLLGNEGSGISVLDGAGIISDNVIANNGLGGVTIPNTYPGDMTKGVTLSQNSMHDNGRLGIDLAYDGVTVNDEQDTDNGPNGLQNHPVLTSASTSGGVTTVAGTLNGLALGAFTIEFFSGTSCDSSGYGEGRTYLGSTTVSTDHGGNAGFSVDLAAATSAGHVVTATATAPKEPKMITGNTSEFSNCVTIVSGMPTTTTTSVPATTTTRPPTTTTSTTTPPSSLPSASIGDVVISEGSLSLPTAVATVSLSKPAPTAVTVSFATRAGTATQNRDHLQRFGTLTFPAGQTSQALPVTIVGDFVDEQDERFTIELTRGVGVSLSDKSSSVTILDDDPTSTTAVGITTTDVSVHEGDAGVRSATFTVSLNRLTLSTVKVNYATVARTAHGSDFAQRSGTLTFAPGVTSLTVSVPVQPDDNAETDETLALTLSQAKNAVIIRPSGTCTILDDD
jgi:hypothetical protein